MEPDKSSHIFRQRKQLRNHDPRSDRETQERCGCRRRGRRLRKHRLFVLFVYFTLGFILLLTIVVACGLEFVLTLNPPEYVWTSVIDEYFSVRITDANDEQEFRGLEFYYKLYYPVGPGSVPDSAINIRSFDDLLANGFKRLSSAGDSEGSVSRPLLKVPPGEPADPIRGKQSLITLDFADMENVEASATPEESGAFTLADFELRRGVLDSLTKEYKKFSDFELTDGDVSSLPLPGLPAEVNLLIYALSFGKEDLSKNVYSRSVYLLRIEIEIDME